MITLPFVMVDFRGAELEPLEEVTSLDAPHRVYDAIIRDSVLDGVPFMESRPGQRLANKRRTSPVATHRAGRRRCRRFSFGSSMTSIRVLSSTSPSFPCRVHRSPDP